MWKQRSERPTAGGVSLLGAGTVPVSEGMRGQGSKWLRQSTKEPPPPLPRPK